MNFFALRLLVCILPLWLGGCSSVPYYAQLGTGHLELLTARQSVASLVADPAIDPELKRRLQLTQQARDFASCELALPDNRSYRQYADLGRPYVLWNVFATPAYSLNPVTHCFPIAGCVAYRGYYSESVARAVAAELRLQGYDVAVMGVEAYSTLGWFADPLLNTMLRRADPQLVGLIFHELAHQQVYVPDDTAFNESFASFVEQQGLRQWNEALGRADKVELDRQSQGFIELLMASRERLQQTYSSMQTSAQLEIAKQTEFGRLRSTYREWREQQVDPARFDAWFQVPLNNARLVPVGLYEQWVGAFAQLFAESGQHWPRFYQLVVQLSQLPVDERHARLQALAAQAAR